MFSSRVLACNTTKVQKKIERQLREKTNLAIENASCFSLHLYNKLSSHINFPTNKIIEEGSMHPAIADAIEHMMFIYL